MSDGSEYICNFCNKTLSSAKSLDNHQKSAKYCLTLQCKVSEKNKCEGCEKSFCNRSWLTQHQLSCSEFQISLKTDLLTKENIQLKLEIDALHQNEIEKLEQKDSYYLEKLKEKNEYISKLEAKLEKLESAVTAIAMESKTSTNPVTTNNTTNHITVTQTNNNVLNLSKEHVNKVLTEHLNYDVVYAGQAGFAKFVVDKMLKGPDGKLTYKCVDPSRQMFEFTDESGETVRDMRAEKLIQSLLDGDAIKIGLDAAAKGWNTEDRQLNNDRTVTFGPRVTEYTELNRHNTVFRNKVSSLTT
jgi:hypothetical protein